MARFEVGKEYRRSDLHAEYGGQEQGGICTPRKHPVIFLFSSPGGERFGYTDGWKGKHYFYSGEGTSGDMVFKRGNKAIRDHGNKEIHLFEQARAGVFRYVGEFVYYDHHIREGTDKDGKKRTMIIFELAPKGEVAEK